MRRAVRERGFVSTEAQLAPKERAEQRISGSGGILVQAHRSLYVKTWEAVISRCVYILCHFYSYFTQLFSPQ